MLGLTHDALGYLIPLDEWKTGRNDDSGESVSLEPAAGDKVRAVILRLYR